MELRDAVEQYLESLEGEGRSRHTVGAYGRDLAAFMVFTGPIGLGDVTPTMLQGFMASDRVQVGPTGLPRAKSTINRYRVALKALFAWAEARWLVERNPTRVLKCRRHRGLPPTILSDSDVDKVLSTEYRELNALRDKALISFMLLTGCRLGETVGLDVGDVDWDCGTVTLRSTKGGDPDRVPLSKRCLACLAACRQGDSSTPLFRSSKGRRLSTRQVQRIVAQRLREAGIDRHVTPHDLRHTFATRLYNRTGDIRLVQHALRHEFVTTTQIYAHVDPQRLRSALEPRNDMRLRP